MEVSRLAWPVIAAASTTSLLGVDGISDFDGMHSRQHDDEVQFYAFDLLVMNGEDIRLLPLHLRQNNLARVLARLTTASCSTISSKVR